MSRIKKQIKKLKNMLQKATAESKDFNYSIKILKR